jgi:putative glutamine amidotransferase
MNEQTTMQTTQSPLVVGVTTRRGDEGWISRNTHNYLNLLESYGQSHGVIPVVLSPNHPARLPTGEAYTPDDRGCLNRRVLDHLDGLILSGGGDVDPRYFGAELDGAELSSIDHKRDELELDLAQAALALDLPLFGICRGCQVLNVAAGGGMIQHFDGHRSPKESTAFHDIVVEADSRFRQIVEEDRFPVNTFHHQGMDRATIAPLFRPAAVAWPDDWLVEAYESATHHWVVGVQWHPERIFELGQPHTRLWQSFLAACREHVVHKANRP